MQRHLWRAGAIGEDLDLAPADAAHAEPEYLADRLLRGPSPRDALDPPTAVPLLVLGEHAFAESIRKAREDGHHAIDIAQVDPDLMAAHDRTRESAIRP